jgi:hypothetical protein
VQPLTTDEIKRSFVNASRSQVASMTLPDLREVDWEHRDFFGWRDRRAPLRAYLVLPRDAGPVGLELRAPTAPMSRRVGALCDLCHSARPADVITLYVARKAGAAGRQDNTIGVYACTDLACSLYVRGRLALEYPVGSANADERVDGLRRRVHAFVDRALGT